MSSDHRSFERSPSARPLWMCLVTSLFLLAASGCSAPPGVQHPGIVFPVMARMSGDLDCINVPGSRVHYNKESCGSALAFTGRLFIASLFLQLHSLVDLLRVMEESLCNYQFHNPYFDARDRSSAHPSLQLHLSQQDW